MPASKLLLTAVLCAVSAQAAAQTLYKCKVEGKVTYQSMPCAKGGEGLDVPPPPTPNQVREARERAEEDRAALARLNARLREQKEKDDKAAAAAAAEPRVAKIDCVQLRTRREELYGQRNADRRNSNLDAMSRTQTEIDKLEVDYTKGNCGPLD